MLCGGRGGKDFFLNEAQESHNYSREDHPRSQTCQTLIYLQLILVLFQSNYKYDIFSLKL